jgi:hypothetical protein
MGLTPEERRAAAVRGGGSNDRRVRLDGSGDNVSSLMRRAYEADV